MDGPCHFHCMSRIINKQFLLGAEEKEMFCKLMRKVEAFSGCSVLTFAVMDNHFHILLAENDAEELSDKSFLDRCHALYSGKAWHELRQAFLGIKLNGSPAALLSFKQKYIRRMHNVSEFMQTLLSRFSQWFNRRHDRLGPLWCGRFKSVLIEGRKDVLQVLAAYIDLNPLRAGLVNDPLSYRWCGVGEAVAGCGAARNGLIQLYSTVGSVPVMEALGAVVDWRSIQEHYYRLLVQRGTEQTGPDGRVVKHGIESAHAASIISDGGRLSICDALAYRSGYFTTGAILGSHEFLLEKQAWWNDRMRLKHPRSPIPVLTLAGGVLAVGRI